LDGIHVPVERPERLSKVLYRVVGIEIVTIFLAACLNIHFSWRNRHIGKNGKPNKIRFIHYIDHWSFLFELQIIMLTLVYKKAYSNAF
jgi:hypothetical protein